LYLCIYILLVSPALFLLLLNTRKGFFMNTQKTSVFAVSACLAVFLTFSGCLDPVVSPSGNTEGPQKALTVNSGNFDSVVNQPGAAIVEFYSAQCRVCAGTAWIIDSLFTVYGDSVLIGASETGSDSLWMRFSIQSVPEYVFFLDGIEVARRNFGTGDSAVFDSLALLLVKILAGDYPARDTSDTVATDTTDADTADTAVADTADTASLFPDTLENGTLRMDSSNFDSSIIISGMPAMVEFFSPLCGHCMAMDSVVTVLTGLYRDSVFFGSVNTMYDDSLTHRFGIQYVPSFLFFKNGTEYHRIIGQVPLDSLVWAIEQGKI
jgi:thioredoxin-like negative regulator of GroEL